jgi:uncharacterized peroxidase-related enzyme
MSYLKRLTKDEVEPEVRALFEKFGAERGNVPNMFRVVAQRPAHLKTMLAHYRTVMNEGTVSPLLKEMVSVLVSERNQCVYWLRSHTALAGRLGATQEQLARITEYEIGPFADAEKAALAFADRMSSDSNGVDQALLDRLRAHFDEGQLVEIALVAGIFAYFNRFNNAFKVQPTQPGEGL